MPLIASLIRCREDVLQDDNGAGPMSHLLLCDALELRHEAAGLLPLWQLTHVLERARAPGRLMRLLQVSAARHGWSPLIATDRH